MTVSPRRLAIAFVLSLAACGDSSNSSSSATTAAPTSATTTFPFDKAKANLVNSGYMVDCSLAGTLGGQAVTGRQTITQTPPVAVTFEGQAGALKSTLTEVGFLTINGRPEGINTKIETVVTSNYAPLGAIRSTDYWVVDGTPPVQATAKVGDLIAKTTYNVYASSQKFLTLGRVEVTGSIDADTSSSAIITWVATTFNIANTIFQTETTRFRMNQFGEVSFVSKAWNYNNSTQDALTCR